MYLSPKEWNIIESGVKLDIGRYGAEEKRWSNLKYKFYRYLIQRIITLSVP